MVLYTTNSTPCGLRIEAAAEDHPVRMGDLSATLRAPSADSLGNYKEVLCGLKPASTTDLLNLLASIETDLAKRATDSRIKRVLVANARRASSVAQRLAKPNAHDWRAYLEAVLDHDESESGTRVSL